MCQISEKSKPSPEDIGHLKKKEKIGKGAFSVVYRYEHAKTRDQMAVKVISLQNLDDRQIKIINREVIIHRALKHENIVKLISPIVSDEFAYIVMELCEDGSLYEHVMAQINKRLDLEEVRILFRQMAAAVSFVHSCGVVHRDIKPANFLLKASNSIIKLADFGLAASIEPGELKSTSCGSINYMAPEILRSARNAQPFYGHSVDVWSLGCCFYFMLVGTCPFNRRNIEATVCAIQLNSQNPIPTHILLGFDDYAVILMDQMLTTDPDARIAAAKILEHGFLNLKL